MSEGGFLFSYTSKKIKPRMGAIFKFGNWWSNVLCTKIAKFGFWLQEISSDREFHNMSVEDVMKALENRTKGKV